MVDVNKHSGQYFSQVLDTSLLVDSCEKALAAVVEIVAEHLHAGRSKYDQVEIGRLTGTLAGRRFADRTRGGPGSRVSRSCRLRLSLVFIAIEIADQHT